MDVKHHICKEAFYHTNNTINTHRNIHLFSQATWKAAFTFLNTDSHAKCSFIHLY